ncbi:hypothetical protein BC832DRAFT_563307 [Gaertneriomyces semiglobifer]|nr:hypothetical protein BC832DRAFT_563307 [Gaertneriomyces semiglobifer]
MRDPTLIALQQKLPFLPGYTFNLDKDIPNERKSHFFDYTNGVPVYKDVNGIGGKFLPTTRTPAPQTSLTLYPQSTSSADGVPAWVAFDRKVLRFYAYFQEAVHERREEQHRVRKVNIYFYLEDDSVHVSEPRVVNSGIPQGTLIRRHRIVNPNADLEGQHYTVKDLNVGREVTFYARTFRIVGCDAFTRDFLTHLSIPVPHNEPFPSDPHTVHRQELASRLKPTRPYIPQTSLKKFLENDRKVLRFYTLWDDTPSHFGDLRHLIIHYYLSDDTVEIREAIPPNSGRDSNTLFLRRQKLPKRRPVWVYGHTQTKEREDGEYFCESDFGMGSILHLLGRPMVVVGCDDFTKKWYWEKYGVEEFDPVRVDEREDYHYQAENPEWINSHDGEGLAQTQLLKKLKEEELQGTATIGQAPPHPSHPNLAGLSLRFSARFHNPSIIDSARRFIITLFLSDESLSIFEPPIRNSGIVGGKFLEKSRVKKPEGGYYGMRDFYIGAVLTVNGFCFVVDGCDEGAKTFMEAHQELFPNLDKNKNLNEKSSETDEKKEVGNITF